MENQTFMTYSEVENSKLNYPESRYEKFISKANSLIEDFESDNNFLELIRNGKLELHHFHALLNTIFHQVYMGSTSFALAGVNVDGRNFKVREYLYMHAEEEQNHWKWIVQNLRDSGYSGPDPREVFPPVVTQAYISYAMYLASRNPFGRLAMGYILEGVSGKLGVKYGMKAIEQLKLVPAQMSFFIQHGELDAGHSDDILEVLESANLTSYEWACCEHAAECTQQLYKAMYNAAAAAIK